jgi:hypothetical protein
MTETEFQRLARIIEGPNGNNGLNGRVSRIERDLYRNHETADPGLVADVRRLQDGMDEIKTTLRNLNWLVRFIGAGGLAALIRWFMQ